MSKKSQKTLGTGANVIPLRAEGSIQTQAAHWLAALDADAPSAETLAAFKKWINADPAHRKEFESLVNFWGELNILTQVSPPSSKRRHYRKPFFSRSRLAGIAAMLLIVFSMTFVLQTDKPTVLVYQTVVGEQKSFELPDHTRVLLNTNSRLVVDYAESLRGVRLEQGEAMFDVFHDKNRPFEVYAGERIVRAVGTAFSVHLKSNDVEVLVAEGIVEIDKSSPAKLLENTNSSTGVNSASATFPAIAPNAGRVEVPKVRVSAGNRAVFSDDLERLVQVVPMNKIEDELSWRTGVLTFDREPLETVINEVSRYTATEFIIPEQEVREMIVGGVFKVGDTESLYEALQLGFGIQAQKVSDKVIYLSRID